MSTSGTNSMIAALRGPGGLEMLIAQSEIASAQAAAAIEQAEHGNRATERARTMAALATAQGSLMILQSCVETIGAATGEMDPEARATAEEAIARHSKEKRRLEQRAEDRAAEERMEAATPEDYEEMQARASWYGEELTAITLEGAARWCRDAIVATANPHQDDRCLARLLVMGRAHEFSLRIGADEKAAPEPAELMASAERTDRARRNTAALEDEAKRAYCAGMPKVTSPQIQRYPGLETLWNNSDHDPTEIGATAVWQGHPAGRELHQDDEPLIIVRLAHRGELHILTLGEPFPAGVPRQPIEQMLREVETRYDLHHQTAEGEMPPRAYHRAGMMVRRARERNELELQSVSARTMTEIAKSARNLGLSEGKLLNILMRITSGTRTLTQELAEPAGIRLTIADEQQAGTILRAARQAGLDDDKLRHICAFLGHDANAMMGAEEPLSLKSLETLMNDAVRAGLPEKPTLRLMEAVVPDTQAFFHCRFNGESFELNEAPDGTGV